MRIRRMAAWLALLTALTGCSMTESALLPSHHSHKEATCASNLGAYYLSKTYLKVVVEQVTYRYTDGAKEIARQYNEVKKIEEVRKPDRSQGYCFDYRASPTATEKVEIIRTKDFLFHYISTEALDQSAYILKTLVRALFIGLSGNKDFTPFRTDRAIVQQPTRNIVLDVEYDPFDIKQSAIVNEALASFQLCLVLENHTFDPRQHTINSYCNNPKRVVSNQKRSTHSTLPHVRKHARGIVYRPRLPYNLYAFTRIRGKDHDGDTWKLSQAEIVHLENEAPNLVIGIERAFFASRRATLVFDEGALKNVCIHKTSELEQLSQVPLEIAGSIAALPTNVLQVRIDYSTNHKNLVAAEQQLIETQLQHLRFLENPMAANVPKVVAPSTGPSGSWVALPNGSVSDLSQEKWPGPNQDWSICPATTKAKDNLMPTFVEAVSGG